MKQCHSCGMPLQTKRAGDCRGTEKSGAKSEKWCSLCYVDGEFVDPNCSVHEMVSIVDGALKREHVWWPMRYMAKKQIPTLERWR